ncbi:MAG: hypothetical protein ACK4PR_00465, partial [Gammaproteobacteria bacterium]
MYKKPADFDLTGEIKYKYQRADMDEQAQLLPTPSLTELQNNLLEVFPEVKSRLASKTKAVSSAIRDYKAQPITATADKRIKAECLAAIEYKRREAIRLSVSAQREAKRLVTIGLIK